MGDAAIRAQLAALMERRHCVRCGTVYVELENLGTWHCGYHPGALDSVWRVRTDARGNVRGTYTCCGREPPLRSGIGVQGCTRCDHADAEAPSAAAAPLSVAAERAELLLGTHRLGAPGVVYDASRRTYTIHRLCCLSDDCANAPR